MECRNKEVAVQCDLQSDTLLPLKKDASTQTGQLHPPVHSSPILLPSESEISDFEDHYHPRDTSYCKFSPGSTSS